MSNEIVQLNEQVLRTELKELVRQSVEDPFDFVKQIKSLISIKDRITQRNENLYCYTTIQSNN